jgi:hypothetical protein
MSLLTFFKWLEQLDISMALSRSEFANAAANVVHLLALIVLAGAVVIVDLRLLGRGTKRQRLADVARDAQPWLIGALIALLLTGIVQLLATPLKEYYSPLFWLKMRILLVTVIFTFTLRRTITLTDESRLRPIWRHIVGLASLALWSAVMIPARLIGLI